MKIVLPENIEGKDNYAFERYLSSEGYLRIAGCDEVGRGPLAGPVIAAAVILPSPCDPSIFLDSKVLSHKKRVSLHKKLVDMGAVIGLGTVSENRIDDINILQASLLAMKRAITEIGLSERDFILVDGKFTIPVNIPQTPLIKGEYKSASIAAASIVAKITRDQFMIQMHERYPHYNFIKNKGYPTKEHRAAIAQYGICPIHRLSFKGVKEYA